MVVTTKRLARIAPLRAGMVLGILSGVYVLTGAFIQKAFLLLQSQIPEIYVRQMGAQLGVLIIMIVPIGFVAGVVIAIAYNFLADITGGLEFDVAETDRKKSPATH